MALQTYLSSCIVYAPSSAKHASGSHGSFHLRRELVLTRVFNVPAGEGLLFKGTITDAVIPISRNEREIKLVFDDERTETTGIDHLTPNPEFLVSKGTYFFRDKRLILWWFYQK